MKSSIYKYLKEREPLAIAFSGGTDSSALILFCRLNHIKYVGFTIAGPHITDYEIQKVVSLRREYGLNHCFFYCDYKFSSQVARNSRRRCFYCKSNLFSGPVKFFFRTHIVADGTNSTDLLGYRPGIESIRAHGIISPFVDLGMTKDQIIGFARKLGLKANKADSRSCILARFSYGVYLDHDLVIKIRRAEDFLLQQGLSGFRFRVLKPGDYLLQIDEHYGQPFFQIKAGFDQLVDSLGLKSYSIQLMPFGEITGYYD